MRKKPKNLVAILLGAAGAGAGVMYLLDPSGGGRRRGFIGEKAVHVAKLIGRGFRRQGRDVGNRAEGVVAETNARIAGESMRDEVLAERVRSKMGRVLSHPRAVDVTAERGVVELRGAVLRSERRRAIWVAESVRGVRVVHHDALRTYSDEQGIPGFQPPRQPSEVKEPKRHRRLRGLRLGIALASGAIAVYRAFKTSSEPRAGRPEEEGSSKRAA